MAWGGDWSCHIYRLTRLRRGRLDKSPTSKFKTIISLTLLNLDWEGVPQLGPHILRRLHSLKESNHWRPQYHLIKLTGYGQVTGVVVK